MKPAILAALAILVVVVLRHREPDRAVAPLRWRGPVLHDDSPAARMPRLSVATLLVKGDDRDCHATVRSGGFVHHCMLPAGHSDWHVTDYGATWAAAEHVCGPYRDSDTEEPQPSDPYPASLLR